MMTLLKLALTALLASHVVGFSTTPLRTAQRPLTRTFAAAEEESDDQPFATLTTKPNAGKPEGFDFQELLSNVQDFDISTLTANLDIFKTNALQGEFGERGEAYFAAQVAAVLCILGGGIPLVGDAIMLLLGPGLLLAGMAVMAISFVDMGPSLSPWPKPTNQGLVTDGLYSKVRHPMYAGLLAACAGFSIVTGSANRLLLTAVLIYVVDVKSSYEEAELTKVYPEYPSYAKTVTGKFFPQEILDLLPWMKKD